VFQEKMQNYNIGRNKEKNGNLGEMPILAAA
jgi:hypothetical protein